MPSVSDIIFEALKKTNVQSTRDDVVGALAAEEPDGNLNLKHAVARLERWEWFLASGGESPFHSVELPTHVILQLALRESYLDSVGRLPFKWTRDWRLRLDEPVVKALGPLRETHTW